jgi:CheY-like chemotaxis protein
VLADNPDDLFIITAALDETGYKYVTATDSRQALALARQDPPVLILMDIQRSDVSGLEIAPQIKADPRLAAAPIVALTAMSMPNQREEILAAGLDDYLAKPFEPQDLVKKVRRWLG